ncbi:MAG: hypothetical protein QM750_20610 [Rubrivivax sp.]
MNRLGPDGFKFYDVSDFPVVRIRGSTLPAGYAPQWIREMDALLANAEPFAFVFLDGAENPEHEDQKAQMKWLKANKKALARVCRGIAAVEPDRGKRILRRAQAVAISAAFGLRMSIAPDPQEAEVRARRFLSGHDVPDDGPE